MRLGLVLVLSLEWAAAPRVGTSQTVYQMTTVAGNLGMGDQGPATAAQLGTVQGIAVDRHGNIYLSDTANNRVRKIDSTGVITNLAGTGTPGFSGDGGPATSAQLKLPYGLAADLAGNVYVADLGNNRVRRIAADGTITTFAGTGERGSAGDGGPATSAQFLTPRNLAVDAAGALYISEFDGHRVRKVTPDGNIATVAGIGIAGFGGDYGLATAAQLSAPAGLAVDRGGALYIADSKNQRVRKILSGGTITTVLGGTAATSLALPVGLAVDSGGTIYVADASKGALFGYSAAGAWTKVFSGKVLDVAADLSGNLYIADYIQIRKASGGAVQTVAGDGYAHVGDGGSALSAQLFQPAALSLDAAGNLYIADAGTQRIRRVTPAGTITTVAGTGVAGSGGDGGPATAALLDDPMGIAMSPSGNLILADTKNNRIRQLDAAGRISTMAGPGNGGLGQEGLPGPQMPLASPSGVCADRTGTLYIADTGNNRVLRTVTGSTVLTAAGNGSPGYAGDGEPGKTAQLNQPMACAADAAGNLFLADTSNHAIRKVAPDGTISTVAGTGVAGLAGDGGPAAEARLNSPSGVAIDDTGDLFIADSGNNLIREVTSDGRIQTIAGGDNSTPPLNSPGGLLLDASGNLYIADTGNNLVRKLSLTTVTPPAGETAPPLSIVNAASTASGPVAPGEIVTVYGQGLGPQAGVVGTTDATGLLANLVGGTEVRFDGVPAPVFYAQATQVNVQVPYTIAGAASTSVEVRYNGQSVGALTVPVAAAAPGLFPVITNQDGSQNSQTQPATRNSIITLYATGEGMTNGPNVSGQAAAAPYPAPNLPVTLSVAGVAADILYAGSAPGQVGIMQINARVPGGFVPAGQATVQLRVGTSDSAPLPIWLN